MVETSKVWRSRELEFRSRADMGGKPSKCKNGTFATKATCTTPRQTSRVMKSRATSPITSPCMRPRCRAVSADCRAQIREHNGKPWHIHSLRLDIPRDRKIYQIAHCLTQNGRLEK